MTRPDRLFQAPTPGTEVTVVLWTSDLEGTPPLCWVYAGHLTEEQAIGAVVTDTLDASWGTDIEDFERAATYADLQQGAFVRRTEYLRA